MICDECEGAGRVLTCLWCKRKKPFSPVELPWLFGVSATGTPSSKRFAAKTYRVRILNRLKSRSYSVKRCGQCVNIISENIAVLTGLQCLNKMQGGARPVHLMALCKAEWWNVAIHQCQDANERAKYAQPARLRFSFVAQESVPNILFMVLMPSPSAVLKGLAVRIRLIAS